MRDDVVIMKEIIVLWSHPDDPTIPPPACPDTCRSIAEVVSDFREIFGGRNITFSYVEEICLGNEGTPGRLTVDGTPLEELVPLPDPSKYCGMACDGCGQGGNGIKSCSRIYEQIPESVLRLALSRAAAGYN